MEMGFGPCRPVFPIAEPLQGLARTKKKRSSSDVLQNLLACPLVHQMQGQNSTPVVRPVNFPFLCSLCTSMIVCSGLINTASSIAGALAAERPTRYWTRPPGNTWTWPPENPGSSPIITPHKWRPQYDPRQHTVNSLQVVALEWTRLGDRWGYAPIGPWCGRCIMLELGCQARCQKFCGTACNGLRVKGFTDEIGCEFCETDGGYGCSKYEECRNNCQACKAYEPLLNHTDTKFEFPRLSRDIWGKDTQKFRDAEAGEPWAAWGNPYTAISLKLVIPT